jgi:hypothetical protein
MSNKKGKNIVLCIYFGLFLLTALCCIPALQMFLVNDTYSQNKIKPSSVLAHSTRITPNPLAIATAVTAATESH